MTPPATLRVQSPVLNRLRVAIVHDYLNQQGGAEKVVEVFRAMFPEAPVFTSVFDRRAMGPAWQHADVRTSFMRRLSPRLGLAKPLLPLYPIAFETIDLDAFDLVLSSSSSFAKGVLTRPETLHVCYCYTPTRFLWMYQDYVKDQRLPPFSRAVLPPLMTGLRVWDVAAAQRVDAFVSISRAVSARIRKFYRRSSTIVEPPVDVSRFRTDNRPGGYYLVLARLQSYKRIDLAVEACNRLKLDLRIAGDGPDRARLQRLAGPSVSFLGRVSDEEATDLLAGCTAVLWPGEEDFGLVPVEAQASGRPVIALRKGGAAETVVDGLTGLHFDVQTVDALVNALERFDPTGFDPAALRRHAQKYDVHRFVQRMTAELEELYSGHAAAVGSRPSTIESEPVATV